MHPAHEAEAALILQQTQQQLNAHGHLQAFESELKKYMAIEQEIAQVAPLHTIGSLALETQPLKYSLKSEAASWKAQYAKNLHKQGSEDLKGFDQYMRDTTLKLNRKVEDLEDVRFIMGVLKEVRSSAGLSLCSKRQCISIQAAWGWCCNGLACLYTHCWMCTEVI